MSDNQDYRTYVTATRTQYKVAQLRKRFTPSQSYKARHMTNWKELVAEKLGDELFFDVEGEQASISCKLHDVTPKSDHNCLGCNFAEQTDGLDVIANALAAAEIEDKYAVANLLFWMNPIIDAAQMVCDICDISFSTQYSNFVRVKRWCNFFKHPKSFHFVHHPEWHPEVDNVGGLIIDEEFIQRYYAGGRRNAELQQILEGRADVVVRLPDMVALTSDFCADMVGFIEEIQEPQNITRLTNKAVFKGYFEELDNAEE